MRAALERRLPACVSARA